MGFSDALFGSGGDVSTSQEPLLNKRQLAVLQQLLGINFEDVRTGRAEENAPQLSPTEVASLQGLNNIAANIGQQPTGANPEATGLLSSAADRTRQILSSGPQDIDKYFRSTVQDPLVKSFTEEILPQIRNSYGANFYGGERMFKEGRATGDLGEKLAQERSRVAFEERNRSDQTALQAAGLTPGLSSAISTAPFAGAGAATDVLSRVLSSAGVSRQQRQGELDARDRQQQLLLQLLGIRPFENITVNKPPSTGFLPGLVTGVSSGIAQNPGLFV